MNLRQPVYFALYHSGNGSDRMGKGWNLLGAHEFNSHAENECIDDTTDESVVDGNSFYAVVRWTALHGFTFTPATFVVAHRSLPITRESIPNRMSLIGKLLAALENLHAVKSLS